MDKKISEQLYLESGSTFDYFKLMRATGGLVPSPLVKMYGWDTMLHWLPFYNFGIYTGRMVMICFLPMPSQWTTTDRAIAHAVSLISPELHAFGAFELVIVFVIRPMDHVPFSPNTPLMKMISASNYDVPSQALVAFVGSGRLTRLFNIDFTSNLEPTGLLINRCERVVWHKPLNFLLEYGVDAFPFTPERLALISETDKCPEPGNSLRQFLCSPPLPFPSLFSFLYKNPGGGVRKKNILHLSHMCVGLYLCQTGNLIPKLDRVDKKCSYLGLEFEIILVYMPFKDFGDPKLFQNRINSLLEERKISWWVLPFVNWVNRRLRRLCHVDADDRLIIVDPKTKLLELHGETVIRHVGTSAYPFSRELLRNRGFERLKALTLESLLVYRSQDYVSLLGSDYSYRVPVAALQGRTVLLYLHYARDHSDKSFDQLISYCQTKAEDPNFAVVFIALDKTSFNNFGSSYGMPWLVCPFNREHVDYVTRTIFGKSGKFSTFVAFEKDGRICSLRAEQLVCSTCTDFPFNDDRPEITFKYIRNEAPRRKMRETLAQLSFKALLPLLGKEYFFPDIPLGGEVKPPEMHGSTNEDERDHYSVFKITESTAIPEVPQYPSDIHENIPNIDPSNFDVVSFLSADNRNYLVRNDRLYTEFKVESLRDKEWVMICCFFCPVFYNTQNAVICAAVSRLCDDLYEKYGDSFEMVLVLKMYRDFEDDESAFNHMTKGFPSSCLVVPYMDSRSRDAICCSLGFSFGRKGLLVRANKVIWQKSLYVFTHRGVDMFPFTTEHVGKIDAEECSISWNSQSLEDLLGCSSATVITKNPGGVGCCETTIEQLKEKLVGVYMCSNGESIPGLHEMYKCCKANNIEFEIVVVYFPFSATTNPKLLEEKINRDLEKRKISWWVLPFKSWVSQRLRRLVCSDSELIIVGKGVVDPNGSDFIRQFERLLRRKVVDVSGFKQKVIDELNSKYLAHSAVQRIVPGHCCDSVP